MRHVVPEWRRLGGPTRAKSVTSWRAVLGAPSRQLSPKSGRNPCGECAPGARGKPPPPLTCASAPVVRLAHPLVALAQGPEEHAGLAHVTDADPAVAPAAAMAQSAPWGLPGRAAPALRFGPGQPARGTRPNSARATNHSRAMVKSRHSPFCSEPTFPPTTLLATFNFTERKSEVPHFSGPSEHQPWAITRE